MPLKEFNALFRMRSSFLNGFFDHNKEILFPEEKNGTKGYRVITPFYYYISPSIDFKHPKQGPDGKVQMDPSFVKGGMAVDRGWYLLSIYSYIY